MVIAGSYLATWPVTWIPEAESVNSFFSRKTGVCKLSVTQLQGQGPGMKTQVKFDYSITLDGHTDTFNKLKDYIDQLQVKV